MRTDNNMVTVWTQCIIEKLVKIQENFADGMMMEHPVGMSHHYPIR